MKQILKLFLFTALIVSCDNDDNLPQQDIVSCEMEFVESMNIDLQELDNLMFNEGYEGYKYKISGDTLMLKTNYSVWESYELTYTHYFKMSKDLECLSHIKSELYFMMIMGYIFYDEQGNPIMCNDCPVYGETTVLSENSNVVYTAYIEGESLIGKIDLVINDIDLSNEVFITYNIAGDLFRYFNIDFTDENQMIIE